MKDSFWDEPTIRYVGRTRTGLRLGNPWCEKYSRQARYFVETKQEAIDNYREWLHKKIIKDYILGVPTIAFDKWEVGYLTQVIVLARDIQSNRVLSLGCWCVTTLNYEPVPDGQEKCHAEILYKACLQLIDHWKKQDLLAARKNANE
ncbi:MAG: DUF4326 domain-containing protein [Komarekiella atlantica HA4396-MV6]|nr:DUF4326 domain-containing protein [Komarekiella atlantica HA4396-MV6]